MSDAAEAQGTETAESPAVDTSAITDRVEQLASEFGGFRQLIESRLPEPSAPEAEEEPDPWAALLGEEEEEPEPQGPQYDPRQLQQVMQQAIEQGIEQRVGPLHDMVSQLTTQQNLNDLYTRFPDMKDPEVSKATGQAARQLAEQIVGPEHAHVLTNNPEFIANVHMARAGQERAAGEVPATGDTTQLEGGGGAAPGSVEQPNIVQQVMQARRALPKGFA
jgi:hypothetical protein